MLECSVDGCKRPRCKRSWCEMHYARWKRHGDPHKVGTRGWYPGMERKTTLHATMHPTMKDLHWAAGFIEGEGSFDRGTGSARISVHQVNREPTDKLLAMFGGAAKLYKKRRGAIHKSQPSPVWQWYVSGSRARGIMMTLYSLMSAKRKAQIRHALA